MASTSSPDKAEHEMAVRRIVTVQEQLERILASRHFRHSRRYPAFLRFVVETTLAGEGESLRERLIGQVLFQRHADYDTNADPAVRLTAAEVRKRLAQYYDEPEHRDEIRVELHSGSYKPEFVPAAKAASVHAVEHETNQRGSSALGQIWAAAQQAGTKVLICMGVPSSFLKAKLVDDTTLAEWLLQLHTVSFGDVLAEDRLVRLFNKLGVEYTLCVSEDVTFSQLREQPTILIGALSNRWTLKAFQHTRYGVVPEKGFTDVSTLQDKLDPDAKSWVVDGNKKLSSATKDYGIAASFVDPSTGQSTWVIAGIGSAGTMAASEFLTSEVDLRELLQVAPADWDGKHFEAVLESEVVNGIPGRPKVLATTFRWTAKLEPR